MLQHSTTARIFGYWCAPLKRRDGPERRCLFAQSTHPGLLLNRGNGCVRSLSRLTASSYLSCARWHASMNSPLWPGCWKRQKAHPNRARSTPCSQWALMVKLLPNIAKCISTTHSVLANRSGWRPASRSRRPPCSSLAGSVSDCRPATTCGSRSPADGS